MTPEIQAVFDRALARLDAEQDGLRRERLARLRPFLTGDGSATYAQVAAEWGVGESAVRAAVHRLRRRFGTLLQDELDRTVARPK